MKAIKEKAEQLSTYDLAEQAMELCLSTDDAVSLVFDVIIEILQERMPEARFVSFCASLEQKMNSCAA